VERQEHLSGVDMCFRFTFSSIPFLLEQGITLPSSPKADHHRQEQRPHVTPPASSSAQSLHLSTTSLSPRAHHQSPPHPAVSAELPALPAQTSSSASATAPIHPSNSRLRSSSPVSQPVRVLFGDLDQTAAVRGRRGSRVSVVVATRGLGWRTWVLAGLAVC